MGISADYIQQHPISEHYIIESNQDVFQRLKLFAHSSRVFVQPFFGFWQDLISVLEKESFSGILFDTYPIFEKEIHQNHFAFFNSAWQLLKPGGVFTYYSDEINSFSATHLQLLRKAGFSHIRKKIVNVFPPKDCAYWQSSTMVAPIIIK